MSLIISEIPDVDLDVSDREKAVSVLTGYVVACQGKDGEDVIKHNNGLYFQRIPVDPTNNLSAFPYKMAEDLRYYKIDIIRNHVYGLVKSNVEIDQFLAKSVKWSWFTNKSFFTSTDTRYRLTHLSKHYGLCCKYPPTSVSDIAILLALIRPEKRHLIKTDWNNIKDNIWVKGDGAKYFFKKSHGIAFALLVILHAQLINARFKTVERNLYDDDGYF